ncbi:carbon-nitrogen hydrolase family protein [Gammaproteobacteria bacterium]|nr:carbon-nitrogen hydrolase family protein [Gammaproteobacteria bacterium]
MVWTIAACAYEVGGVASWDDFDAKVRRHVEVAVDGGAELMLFPEYFSMELVPLLSSDAQASLSLQLSEMQSLRQSFVDLFQSLAQQHQVMIAAGTVPWQTAPDRFVNRCHLCFPDGRVEHQDKLIMTRFERESWGICAARELKVFHWRGQGLSILTCYDSEFPLLARQAVEAGADLLLVPSCTDGVAGYHRVRCGSRARAMENQCYVLHAPTVGDIDGSLAIDENHGAAAVYGPIDRGFAEDGVVADSPMDEAAWIIADIDFSALAAVRANGQVLNRRHWPEQDGVRIVKATPSG